ncbi:MAG: flagellar assembly protein FliH [bacterium]|jgi:flagellar assembly protein FliH|nr:flagellar assembly protein FliH [Solirubrobacteraceae bacterium]
MEPYLLQPLEPAEAVPDVEDLLAVVAAARAEADAIREEARAEGLAIGRAEGAAAAVEEARVHLQPAAQALREAAEGVARLQAEAVDGTERRAVELALELASKIVAGTIEVEPDRVLDAVRGALRCLVERERIHVLVHPDDLASVREAMAGLAGELGGIEHVEVQEERRIARGGALVRTTDAEIDASVQTKLERAREVVMAELERA